MWTSRVHFKTYLFIQNLGVYRDNAAPTTTNNPAATPEAFIPSLTAAPVCELAGEVDVLLAVLLVAVPLVSALVMFLHDDVALEGTEALLDKVRSAH